MMMDLIEITKQELDKFDISEYNIDDMDKDNIMQLDVPLEVVLKLLMAKDNQISVKKGRPVRTQDELLAIALDKLANAKLSDDQFFKIFMQDLKICKMVLEALLKSENIDIGEIEHIELQKEFNSNYISRGVRLDVFIKGTGRVYNIEMQTGKAKDLLLRMRYYQSLMDSSIFYRGSKNYKDLIETYVLFICTDTDPFEEGDPEYLWNMCRTSKSKKEWTPGDTGAKWIVFSVPNYEEIEGNEDLKSLFSYIKEKPRTDSFTNIINERCKEVRLNKNARLSYMTLSMRDFDIREECLAEGRAEGRVEGRVEGRAEGKQDSDIDWISRLVGFKYSIDEIVKLSNCSKEYVEDIINRYVID